MQNITENFGMLYKPVTAIVVYESVKDGKETYVEHFDMDENGVPRNAHPLTVLEAELLAKCLVTDDQRVKAFLKPKGILPICVLHIDPSDNGSVIWFTKSRKQMLYFSEKVGIAEGEASIPPLLWKADRENLYIYALHKNKRPDLKSKLYYAPFLNVYEDGSVCMGTVDTEIKESVTLEEFMAAWENFFFNSYFSHLVDNYNPIDVNFVGFWNNLIETNVPFPLKELKPNNKTLKSLWK
jgi:PRTRC genetic system protein B